MRIVTQWIRNGKPKITEDADNGYSYSIFKSSYDGRLAAARLGTQHKDYRSGYPLWLVME